jgi:hypothetical protein
MRNRRTRYVRRDEAVRSSPPPQDCWVVVDARSLPLRRLAAAKEWLLLRLLITRKQQRSDGRAAEARHLVADRRRFYACRRP